MRFDGLKNEVRALFAEMSPSFKDHLMNSFLWTEAKLNAYLNRKVVLEGDELRDAYSHLESLLARIEGYAAEKTSGKFPSYEEWVKKEFHRYKVDLHEDHEDIERLMGEGGVYAPGKVSPETMESDTLAHYHQQEKEFKLKQDFSKEAQSLMKTETFKKLKTRATEMNSVICAASFRK